MNFNIVKAYTHVTPRIVDERLYRGRPVFNPVKLQNLKKQGITQIIDLRCIKDEKVQILSRYSEFLMCKLFNIKYKNIPYSHKKVKMPEMDFFEKINDLIRNNEGKTYIHCRHGKRRTGVCVAIYEKIFTSKTQSEILDELFTLGFKELNSNSKSIPPKIHNKLVRIYNNFVEEHYPEAERLK